MLAVPFDELTAVLSRSRLSAFVGSSGFSSGCFDVLLSGPARLLLTVHALLCCWTAPRCMPLTPVPSASSTARSCRYRLILFLYVPLVGAFSSSQMSTRLLEFCCRGFRLSADDSPSSPSLSICSLSIRSSVAAAAAPSGLSDATPAPSPTLSAATISVG